MSEDRVNKFSKIKHHSVSEVLSRLRERAEKGCQSPVLIRTGPSASAVLQSIVHLHECLGSELPSLPDGVVADHGISSRSAHAYACLFSAQAELCSRVEEGVCLIEAVHSLLEAHVLALAHAKGNDHHQMLAPLNACSLSLSLVLACLPRLDAAARRL